MSKRNIVTPVEGLLDAIFMNDPNGMIQLKGEVTVQAHDRSGRLVWEKDLGKNVICTRARMVLSRLIGQNLKQFFANAVGTYHPDWATYFGKDYYDGSADPGSFAYPFAPGDTGTYPNSLTAGSVFGGVPTDKVYDWTNPASPPTVASQNGAVPNGHAYHHGSGATDTNLLYALGITGMAFGNGGHLLCSDAGTDPTVAPNPVDTKGYIMAEYVSAGPGASLDVPDLPAEPYDLVAGQHGYSWPGGGVKATYPNLHQPSTFSYESTINGVVPWGYAGLAGIDDNMNATPGGVRCAFEGNSTLFSETMRLPLDKDGIEYLGTSIRFKVTIPSDSELNQLRNFGYARRPRNWITEAGLITGENLLVQSPEPRTATISPIPLGTSNYFGAALVESGTPNGTGFWTTCVALPKDYYTRFRNPLTGEYFVDSYGQLDANHNNVFNLITRKVFGIVTKSQDLSYSFLWVVSFG